MTTTSFQHPAERQVAVLIDYENVGLNSIQWLFDQLADVGRIIVKRAYGDWSEAAKDRDHLLELGIEAIHLFHAPKSGKNASDIRLAIDAIELLYQSPVDTFVVVSSDSDFVALVSKLRSSGKMVIGAGRKATTSTTLVKSCDRYLYLELEAKARRATRSRRSRRRVTKESLLARAVQTAMDETGRVTGSKLHQTMTRLDPSFDFRAQGFSTFAKFLAASTEVKLTRAMDQPDVTVELAEAEADAVAEPATP